MPQYKIQNVKINVDKSTKICYYIVIRTNKKEEKSWSMTGLKPL